MVNLSFLLQPKSEVGSTQSRDGRLAKSKEFIDYKFLMQHFACSFEIYKLPRVTCPFIGRH